MTGGQGDRGTGGPGSTAVEREAGLKRELTPGQVTMIALGGAIGTGLFLGSTIAIHVAGPAVVVSYLIGAIIAFIMTQAVGQLTVRHPTAGSFGVHAEIYLGKWAGFTVKWSYWFAITISIGGEAVACGLYIQHWLPGTPLWLPVVLVSLGLVAINAMHVGAFGTFEYWFAMIKVVAIVLFILFGVAILTGIRPADVPGASGYTPFAPMGWGAIFLALPVVMFSYLGTEIIAITSGEAQDPEKSIPRALRVTVWRLIAFYVLSMALLVALMPWQQISSERSPFVVVFEIIGVPGAATLMNFVVLTAALSSMNTNLYITSRMLFSLARSGDAPAAFGRLGERGTPMAALLASATGMVLAAVVSKVTPGDAFVYFFGVAIFGGLYCWGMIFATHVRYQLLLLDGGARYAVRGAPELPAAAIRDYAPWRIFASTFGLIAMVLIIGLTWFIPAMRITLQSGVPWLLLLTVAWAIRRNMMRVAVVILAASLFAGHAQAQAPARDTTVTVVRAGHLIDGVSDNAATDQAIVIQNGRIQSVGPWASSRRPSGARVIDLSNAWVLPGLIDNHTHLLLQGDITTEDYNTQLLDQSIPYRAILGARNANRALMQGFTALRDLETEGAMYADVDIKRAINRGEIPGPRLWVATRAMAPTGAYGITTPNWDLELPTGVQIVDGPDNIRQAVREQVRHGADLIKFYADRSYYIGPDSQIHSRANYTEEEARALVDEAHRQGRPVAAHASGREGIESALRAGVNTIEHGFGITDDLAQRMAQQGVFYCPTIFIGDYMAPGRTAEGNAFSTQVLPYRERAFRAALRAGVKISYGTDVGGFDWGQPIASDFPYMVRYGMTTMQAIKSATSVAAELLGQTNNIGSIQAGRYADIIALPADPLADISALGHVAFVMKGGVIYKQ